MNKKKVGELEGTPIVIGKKNYANEHEYYLTMNEDNTYQKLEQRVSGDKFRLVLGGGSNNYPTVTAGDVNKVWQVTPVQKGTKTEEIVIVPEQTLVNNQELAYNDKFVLGAQCIAVINGVEYRGEVIEGLIIDYYSFETEYGGFIYDSNNEIFRFFNSTEFPEVTAKLSVIEETPIYDYNWAPGVKVPIPTAEDEGKILVVNEVEVSSKEYELAPTQTVTITGESVVLQNTSNLDKFVKGATVTLVLNGTAYTGQVVNDGGLYVVIDAEHVTWELDLIEDGGESGLHLIGDLGTYEVSVSVLEKEYSYEYQLQEDSGSGFKYNELPEPAQFRNPTEEEFNPEIFGVNNGEVLKVLDLKNGIVPKEIIIENSDNGGFEIYQLTGYKFNINSNQVYYCMCVADSSATDIVTAFGGSVAFISKDGTLLGILDMGVA